MAIENDLDVFSVRIPVKLGEQLRKMAVTNKRSRNSQIVFLLEQAVDLHKARNTREASTLKT